MLFLASLVVVPRWCHAVFGVGDVVIDPTNLVQNSLTALRTLHTTINQATQIANDVRMIANQVQQLANEARNLASLPTSLLGPLQGQLRGYTATLSQAQGLSFQLSTIAPQFEQLYTTFGQPARPSAGLLQQASQWAQQLRDASAAAMQVQSVWERLTGQQARLQTALTASDNAGGNLQVSQATNHLLGIMAEQHASLQQILAASSRAEAALIATQAAHDDAARANAAHFMEGFTSMTPVQGIGIPPFR
ncbi:MAG TPA: P-type conjugative transfer protein TrbJ [Candidatus Limnocylindrales bacterium]|nr:P-type conjugative transfer protein TrbJ [Candidatus Limnocylindrales bacterium]